MENQIEIIMGLLVVVAALAIVARRISIPYPILLVLGGLALALIPGFPRIHLAPNLVFLIFLPPLLYPAALFTSWRDFHDNLRPILLLAVGLVLFTTCAVGFFAHYIIAGLPLAAAFALGAIVSPPDAVAATAITERLRVPRRIVTILEDESLVNDAIALVAYRFAIAALMTGSFSLAQATFQFVIVAVGGVLIGLIIGWIAARVQRRLDDPPVQITLSLLTPFAAYLTSERLGVSGVLAVVTAGLYLGWRNPEIVNSRMRLQAGPVWEMIVFLLNGFVFILIGLQLPEVLQGISTKSGDIFRLTVDALLISLVVIVVRFAWVIAATYLPRLMSKRLREKDPFPPWQSVIIIAWTGMRGVVSLAAAIALPSFSLKTDTPVSGRSLIIFFTFVVIFVTLVLQGLSLPYLIRWLKVVDGGETEKEEREARLKANLAALERLAELEEDGKYPTELLQRLRAEYEDRIRQLEVPEPAETSGRRRLFSEDYTRLEQEALRVERQTILQLRNERVINDEALRRIQHDLDLAEERVRSAER
ncbi:MAG TPA: Na+/H+ antiporter [Verrucomicrobiae bacterium]|nr:Na+/H+ antiporter [Verrucomicrobiae bacterium]